METTLASLLKPHTVAMSTLHERYGALLELVRKLIGVVPNCDPYLEIWPPGFRTYNVLVPNFLNLPFSIWGLGAPSDVVGLAMYVASRTAECAYCSAHTCSFALRRGAAPEKIARALDDESLLTAAERAVVAVARSLSRIPSDVTEAERVELGRHFSAAKIEWIVLGVAMMGFLNKFMDAVGVELESATLGEVRSLIAGSGWAPGKHLDASVAATPPVDGGALPHADSLGTKLGVVPFVPAALALDMKWTAGAPKRWPQVGDYLRERTGHNFPILSRMRHARAIRAIAVMLRDNLDKTTSVIGLPQKLLAGLVYATIVGDAALASEVRTVAEHNHVTAAQLDEVVRFASSNGELSTLGSDGRAQAALRLAKAISPSPAQIASEIVDACRTSELPPAAIVGLVVWLSLLQLLHRLTAFYPAAAAR